MNKQTQGALPQGGFPQQGTPQYGFPQQGTPQDGLPQQGYPQDGFPQQRYPQDGFPQQGYPQDGFPQQRYPQGGFPQQGYAQGDHLPSKPTPQGDHLPSKPTHQGGYPPQENFPKVGEYPPGAYTPPQPEFQPGFPSEAYTMPGHQDQTGLAEDGNLKNFDFNEQSIRRGFIRKVYSILMVQLLVTLSAIAVFVFDGNSRLWVMRNPMIIWIAIILMFSCLIAMACCEGVRRKTPMNFIFLGVFTVAQSLLLGVISSRYDSNTVLIAVGITAAICLALTLFAFQTRFDFTIMGGMLLCGLVVLTLFGFIMIFISSYTVMSLVYASIGALLFSLYLVYDTQLMMSGKHKYTISPEEYVFAALNLYLDIINILIFILRIVGAARN